MFLLMPGVAVSTLTLFFSLQNDLGYAVFHYIYVHELFRNLGIRFAMYSTWSSLILNVLLQVISDK